MSQQARVGARARTHIQAAGESCLCWYLCKVVRDGHAISIIFPIRLGLIITLGPHRRVDSAYHKARAATDPVRFVPRLAGTVDPYRNLATLFVEPLSSTAVASFGFFLIEIGACRARTWNNRLHFFLQLPHRVATGREMQLGRQE